ncbi:4-amino-4-deoxy-L-arabinose lipid A transferase [Erwinia sp. OLTSP20]|uniref:lipid IV(A) 4-amino-4-deoxy-L-arabinosyltransferase n=1 Tax=unclassified Erwinia TaxID=2622719 RepID=UPI000C18769F|nr:MULTISPECIES: lipid IV(A) 4-amino-4-deoxy-L-arabinosyltransferase [unclassified Erwinia]PIJ50726.1 4-amino-4-deoxy-L-arabinose lipid A transferase [Erwinia sp. OAMSP11]PIJ75395.1 4-amino-4-deoxy-L-arabinose lipid A transferase [Erwinia sp. OLSSP12]PIJ81893.1 4-amino-4-deoxy-L-arabinose lipid A transferase [Erwinia sp. OLCASP19]PIJ84548.1 4-amino-4-deoxy-L-arabinose lipid A transferase [Erwinia sp. OLMTSP26]PIJ86895.1 4-amino-4-deoxy-L-arabinose lipid A transferase [Erwinia sp. OLMDSP33]
MSTNQKGWLLLLLFALYYLVPLEFRQLWQPDETRYAEISREMLASGNWIVPHFLDVRYFEKPIAGYWINNLSQLLFGHNNFAVRFGSVFSITLSAIGVYWLASRIWQNRATGLIAGVIYLSTLQVYGIGTYATLDPMITLWMTAAMCFFWLAVTTPDTRCRLLSWLLLGIACGMGFMTKGFLALAVPVIAILPWVVIQKRWKTLLSWGWLAIFGALAVSLPWVLAVAQREPDYWHYFFWVQHIQRFAEDNAQHKAPFWYYLPVLIAGSLPWLALLPGALKLGWKGREGNGAPFYLLGWMVMPFLFFSIAKGKLPTYILPCFAPLAILMAHYASTLLNSCSKVFKINAIINLVFGLVCMLVLLVALAPWGIEKHSLYAHYEIPKVLLGTLTFAVWALMGWLSLQDPRRRWQWAAVCPLGIALLYNFALPQHISSKQPQHFITAIHEELSASRYVLTDSVGLGAALAWELKRGDVMMYSEKGELDYGLAYPDASHQFVSDPDFPQWLENARHQGNVSLVLQLDRDQDISTIKLPHANFTWRQGRLILFYYQKQP